MSSFTSRKMHFSISDIQTTINNLHVTIVLALSTMIIDNSWKDIIISMVLIIFGTFGV